VKVRHVDVLIVGAGISGIGAAYYLQVNCPNKTYAIAEARGAIGGTWDLFRYPGIRSDSDMYTFGFKFKPWVSAKAISPGEDIRNYLIEAAAENGIDKHINFGHKVIAADWSSETATWTTRIRELATNEVHTVTSNFFLFCGGYYNYEEGYTPDFSGVETFKGQVIHPQKWPEDLDYSNKHVVVIGSGATAVTLLPTMAKKTASITMLQRSPTYIAARPEQDKIANFLRRVLPTRFAYSINRWKNILLGMYLFSFARRKPEKTKKLLKADVRQHLGPDYDVDKHFTPRYNPWDQRLCLVPDGDLFDAIRRGTASIVTDEIDRFTENGIKLKSGEELSADVIVTATGLNAELLSGMQLSVDGNAVDLAKEFVYKGMMLSGLPNFAFSVGYTNASWTLKSDMVGEYVCRLLNYMDKRGFHMCVATVPAEGIESAPLIDFSSGYIRRALDQMPKQGVVRPWKLHQNYILDRISLGWGSVTDVNIVFR